MASSVIMSLRAQQSEILRKLAEMQPLPSQGGFAAPRPDAIRMEEARRANAAQISAEVGRIIANLENDYAASAATMSTALRSNLKRLTGGAGADAGGQAKLREAQSVADANRQVYAASLNKLKELEQSQTMQEPEARMFENARVPDKPNFRAFRSFSARLSGSDCCSASAGLSPPSVSARTGCNRRRLSLPYKSSRLCDCPCWRAFPFLRATTASERGLISMFSST